MNRAACLSVLLFTAPASLGLAQGYQQHALIRTPSGLCLDLEGDFNHASPPPVGTHVIVATCDGSDSQRWRISMGAFQDNLRSVGSLTVGGDATHAVLVPHVATTLLRNGEIRTIQGCATTPMNAHSGDSVMIKPCIQSAEQRFVSTDLPYVWEGDQ